MGTHELRQDFHQLIDSIEDKIILQRFYKLFKAEVSSENKGELWKKLSVLEQNDLLISYAESENPDNLISHNEMKKKHQKWL